MCASYGLGGGTGLPLPFGLAPNSAQASLELLAEWAAQWQGKANTTREQKRGVNLNPVLHAPQGERRLDLAWWWWHIGGRIAPYTAFNSRDDALTSKWKAGFQRRALLPAEWYSEGGKRWTLPDGSPFMIAAILSERIGADDSRGLAYSMVTRHGIGEASTVISSRGESRMPLVLPESMHDEWLDPERPGDDTLIAAVQLGSEEISRAMTAGGAATLF